MRSILVLVVLLLGGAALGASDSPRQEVPASEILAAIERGEPVEYDNVIIVGDLDLSMVDLPTRHVERTLLLGLDENARLVASSIEIKDSEIRGAVNFGNAIFQEPIDFGGAQFSRNASFIGVQFSGNANFGGAQFNEDADFNNAHFGGDIALNDSKTVSPPN
ncbi:MAG: pentapeptide repeat-containing protein [Methanotrichaceae archaeon]